MKKLLSLFLALVLCCGVIALTGCGDKDTTTVDATFAGNYVEATAEDVEAIEHEAALKGEEGTTIDYADGVCISINMIMAEDNMPVSVNETLYCSSIDNKLVMQGFASTSVMGINMSGSIYFTDGYIYMNMAGLKMKVETGLDGYISDNIGEALSDLGTILEDVRELSGVKYAIDRSSFDGKLKVKISYSDVIDGNCEVCFVYNPDMSLSAIKINQSMTFGGITEAMDISIKPWDGMVQLPADLDTYVEEDDLFM